MNRSELERKKTEGIYWEFIESSLKFLNHQDKSFDDDFERLWVSMREILEEHQMIAVVGNNYFATQSEIQKTQMELGEQDE